MNKLIIDEQEYTLDQFEGELQINTHHCLLHLKKENKITKLTLQDTAEITMHLLDCASLWMEDSWSTENSQIDWTIQSENQTNLQIRLYIEAKKDYQIILKNHLLGSDNKTNIQVHAVTNTEGTVRMQSVGYIAKNTENNEFLEELKGLTLNQKSIIFLPDLIVDSDAVIANHNATIKCVDEQELFYLESKGLPKEIAKDLIKNGFLNK